jgi:aerobic C4-dicarboxylate transport protein
MASGEAAPRGGADRKVVKQLWFWVIVAIVLGVVFGLVAPDAAKKAKWLADAFLQLIKTVTGPVIFVTVVVGIASLGTWPARAGSRSRRWATSCARRWWRSRSG